MRPVVFAAVLLAGWLPALANADRERLPAYASKWAGVEIYDRTDQRTLPIYVHEDELYVAGEPGHQYEIRLRNRSNERLLAVTSVDGVNVISGETAATEQSGYVLPAWDSVEIDGWRKSMDEVATFYFTRLSKSYAARTGRPENVGAIGVAVFRERRRCCRHYRLEQDNAAAAEAPQAPSAPLAEADESVASSSARQSREKLGTGHGHREDSPIEYVDFQRASSAPEDVIIIYYDSTRNLVARGVIREPGKYADRRPDPFPNGFVPDP
ncbi:MAG: hypothetical protein ABW171_02380 [Steroidobacter sp.]